VIRGNSSTKSAELQSATGLSRAFPPMQLCDTGKGDLSAAPILFGLTPDRWRLRVFDLHPMRRTTRTVDDPSRLDTAELASVFKEGVASTLKH